MTHQHPLAKPLLVPSKMVYKLMLSSSLPMKIDASYSYFSCKLKIRLLIFIQGITSSVICIEIHQDFYAPCQSSNLSCKKTCDPPIAFVYLSSFFNIKDFKQSRVRGHVKISITLEQLIFNSHLLGHGFPIPSLVYCLSRTCTY